jgi:hypothetical protein
MQLFPASSQSSRDTHGMAYEPNSQRIVLFGGHDLLRAEQPVAIARPVQHVDDLDAVVDFAVVDEEGEPVHEPDAHTDQRRVGELEQRPWPGFSSRLWKVPFSAA